MDALRSIGTPALVPMPARPDADDAPVIRDTLDDTMPASPVTTFGHLDVARNFNKLGTFFSTGANPPTPSYVNQIREENVEFAAGMASRDTASCTFTASGACWAVVVPFAGMGILLLGLGTSGIGGYARATRTRVGEAEEADAATTDSDASTEDESPVFFIVAQTGLPRRD